jgi:4,5-dihydroxyphthalate decarboxylase
LDVLACSALSRSNTLSQIKIKINTKTNTNTKPSIMTTATPAPPLKTLLGDYPVTHALRTGSISHPALQFDFADVKVPNTAFKRTVRNMEFDVSELAIVTFLQAIDVGVPLVLLPAVVISRFQHPYLMYDARRGVLGPRDLNRKRIGVRSYCVTTVTWIRGMLMADYGIRPDEIEWVTFEDAHVAEWQDPASARRADAGKDMLQMLEDGELDAAVLAGPPDNRPHIKTVFPNPIEDSAQWQKQHGVIQINHMVTVRKSVCDARPEVPAQLMDLLVQSREIGLPAAAHTNYPMGVSDVRAHLQFAIDMVYQQGLIRQRYAADSLLYAPVTA